MKMATTFCLAALLATAAPAQDSLNVRRVGSCSLPDEAYALAINGDFAYVADWDSGLRVVSIGDPTHPVEVGHVNTHGRAYDVAVNGQYAYVAAETAGLRVISIADPAHPVEVGHLSTSAPAHAVAVSGQYAYVADDTNGLLVVSVADPAQPTLVGSCGSIGQVEQVTVDGSRAYVATSGLYWIVSIADPAHPNVIGGGLIIGVDVLRVDATGDYAYLSTHANGVHIYNVVDPQYPVLLGICCSEDLAWGVALTSNYAFVAADEAGLRVVSITNPASPSEVGYYDMIGWVNAVALTPNYIYAAYGRAGLQVLQFYGGGVEETPSAEERETKRMPTVVRGVLLLTGAARPRSQASGWLLNAAGRKAADLRPGANDVSGLAPGVYFVCSTSRVLREATNVTKVIIAK